MAQINVEIVTIDCGKLVKNKVTLEIPVDAAEIIYKAWLSDKMPQHEEIIAQNLMDNQVANCELVVAGAVVAGMQNMATVNTDERLLSIIYPDEED